MTAQPNAQPNIFDVAPALKMYMESIEVWKKNYETFVKSAKELQSTSGADGGKAVQEQTKTVEKAASVFDNALLNWQKSSEDLFKRFVEQQIELCRFFATRWEQWLKLTDQVSHCRSVTELGNVHAAFMSQCANDYMHETEKLAQPVTEAISNLGETKSA